MQDFFYGWYLKCQSATQTLAVIPAIHQTGRERTCSIIDTSLHTFDKHFTYPWWQK